MAAIDAILERNLIDPPDQRKRIAVVLDYAQYLVPAGEAGSRSAAGRLVRVLGWAANSGPSGGVPSRAESVTTARRLSSVSPPASAAARFTPSTCSGFTPAAVDVARRLADPAFEVVARVGDDGLVVIGEWSG